MFNIYAQHPRSVPGTLKARFPTILTMLTIVPKHFSLTHTLTHTLE
jgi:hypothetical protein